MDIMVEFFFVKGSCRFIYGNKKEDHGPLQRFCSHQTVAECLGRQQVTTPPPHTHTHKLMILLFITVDVITIEIHYIVIIDKLATSCAIAC